MSYQNGHVVSDINKNVTGANAKLASDVKSEAKNLKSDLNEDLESAKAAADKVESRLNFSAPPASSLAEKVVSSAMALLPIKNADEVVATIETAFAEIRAGVATARTSASTFVRKYPMYSLVGAAVLGASAALIISKRTLNRSADAD